MNGVVLSCAASWLLVSVLEAARLSDGRAEAAPWIGALVAPAVLVSTLMGGLASWLLEPGYPWGLPRWLADREGRAQRAASVGILAGSFFVGALTLGSAGLTLLATSDGNRRWAAVFGGLVLVSSAGLGPLAAHCRNRLALRGTEVGLAVASLVILLATGVVWLGETSGGGGALQLWGVFRREELHLALPAYILLSLVIGYQVPVWLLRVHLWAAPVLAAFFAVAGWWGSRVPSAVAFEIERQTHLAAPSLRFFQRFADADGDGFAGSYGGGDCDDDAPAINPDAMDVPGNGIDEDCSGRDAVGAVEPARMADGAVTREFRSNSAASGASVGTSAEGVSSAAARTDVNVVLITIDTLRYDLGYAGNPRPLSPNIDALARRSTVYDKAYALASYTSKSLGPMMIGRYGSETHRGWMHFNKYPPEDRMVQERLQGAGITTLAVQGHWYFKADTGLGRGFDVLDMSAAPTRPQGEGDRTVNSAQISDAAIGLLDAAERQEQRFFMWVHYLDPHAEYVPHPEFDFGSNGRARYDGEIAFTDFHVGRVLDAIQRAPFSDRTIVILTSDHGEAFNEHGLIRHGFELWEEVVRVPLVVYVPGQAPRRIEQRRSAIDIVPTLLDAFRIPLPEGDDALSGRSMLAEWYGAAPDARPVFIDMPAGPYNGDRQAYIANDMKLITSNSRPMGLYDLASDPGETKNLAKNAELAEPALEEMKQFRAKLRTVKVTPR